MWKNIKRRAQDTINGAQGLAREKSEIAINQSAVSLEGGGEGKASPDLLDQAAVRMAGRRRR